MRSAFFLLLSTKSHTLSRDVHILAARTIEGLAQQLNPGDILRDIFQDSKFAGFLRKAASYTDVFLSNSILHMLETLCSQETYKISEDNLADTKCLPVIRAIVRDTAAALLNSTDTNPSFVMELLLTTVQCEATPPGGSKPSILNDQVCKELLKFLNLSSPTTYNSTRVWCIGKEISFYFFWHTNIILLCFPPVFRLLQFADTHMLVKEKLVASTFKKALHAPEELQALLRIDFTTLVDFFLAGIPDNGIFKKKYDEPNPTTLFRICIQRFYICDGGHISQR